MEFSIKWTFTELKQFIQNNFYEENFDLQIAKSPRNILKYITKEDNKPLTNVSTDQLNFNCQIYNWAENTQHFNHTDPFIVKHRNYYNYIKKYFTDHKNNFKPENFTQKNLNSTIPWVQSVITWWNSRLKNQTTTALLLHGATGVGKSTLIENITNPGQNTIFYPEEGKFMMTGFQEHLHKLILFEEFNLNRHDEDYLKRLTENKTFTYPIKYETALKLTPQHNLITIFVTNNIPNFSDAMLLRLTIIHANIPSF